jgi:hypothetical protein
MLSCESRSHTPMLTHTLLLFLLLLRNTHTHHTCKPMIKQSEVARDSDLEVFGINEDKYPFDYRHFAFTLLRGALLSLFALVYMFTARFTWKGTVCTYTHAHTRTHTHTHAHTGFMLKGIVANTHACTHAHTDVLATLNP